MGVLADRFQVGGQDAGLVYERDRLQGGRGGYVNSSNTSQWRSSLAATEARQ